MNRTIIAGILISSLSFTAGPVSARDQRHQGHDRDHNKHSAHKYYRKPGHHYSPGNHRGYRHNYRHHYRGKHHYRGHRHGHAYNDHYVDDYFRIVGGTILINELLYHGHNHR